MKKVIAKIDFNTNLKGYIKGDEIEGLTYEQIVKLNEKGFIEPLEYKDLIVMKKELENSKNKLTKEED